MNQKNKHWYVADFETTSYKYYQENDFTKVWLWSICDENEQIVANGSTIYEFIEIIKKFKHSVVYFHNLKFDGSFIINWLMTNGYEYVEDLKVSDNKGFSTLIGSEGQYYQIKINFKHNHQIVIQDSLKIIPLSVAEIAKAFDLPIDKEIIDYEKYEINPTTIEYVNHDVLIVAKALKFFKDQSFNKMTIGANAYNIFKSSFLNFDLVFPTLKRDWLSEWRKAYRGGRSQVNPRYANKIVYNIRRYDINSMYPNALARYEMPYGYPIPITKPGKFKFELYKVDICFKLNKGHLPTLLKKSGLFNKGDSYYTETDLIETMYISNIDLELVYRHYDVMYIRYVEMYGFKTSRYLFTRFINTYYELKSNSTGGMKMLYKLIINNLYGKFGSKCKGSTKRPILEDDGLHFELTEEENMTCYYLPVAIAVTSYCHRDIDDAIMKTGYKNFVYCDTDSVHTLGTLPDSMVDNKELGKFKLEAVEDIGKYVRQKCYCHKDGNEYNITCAGMTKGIKSYLINKYGNDIFKIFKVGLKVDINSEGITYEQVKKLPKQVPGGVVLKPTQFQLL